MAISNNNCDGYKLTLKTCYFFMNSQCSNPEVQDNICDDPFNQYINCLQKAMKDKDINYNELRQYHSEYSRSKDAPPKSI